MESIQKMIDQIIVSAYNAKNEQENAENGGNIMTAKEMLTAAFRDAGTNQAEAAQKCGWIPQQMSGRLSRNSLRADDFLRLLDAAGVDVTMTVRETGTPVKVFGSGAGRRVRRMVNHVIYDTRYADAISNDFYADGENEYHDGRAMELYRDREGRYFFAEYTNFDGAQDRIVPVGGTDAAEFIEKYGVTIDKKPQ